MKKLLIGLLALGSISAYADVYKGVDNNGSRCELEIKAQEARPDQFIVIVKTQKILAYADEVSIVNEVIDVSNAFTQGDQDYTLTTTDRIVVKFDDSTPIQYSVKRKRKLNKSGLLGIIPLRAEPPSKAVCTLNP